MRNIFIGILLLLFFSCKDIRKTYYQDGTLESESVFENELPNGKFKNYYPNGNIEQEGNYKDGKEEGLFKDYYETGELEAEVYFKNGKQEGELKEYYQNGTLKSVQNFESNVMNGAFKFYYPNGELKKDAIYKNDSTSYYIEYDSLGNWTDELRIFDVNITGDTVYLGEAFEMEFELNGPIEDSVFVSMNIHYYDEPSKSSNPKSFNLKANKYSLSFTPDIAGKWGCLGEFIIGKREEGRIFRIPLNSFYVLEGEDTAMN